MSPSGRPASSAQASEPVPVPAPGPALPYILFNSFVFLAGLGSLFFRMARDNDDLVRAVLATAAGAACAWFAVSGGVPAAITVPALGFAGAMFMSSVGALNPPESLKEFLKIGVYLLVFLGLASSASSPSPAPRPGGTRKLAWGLGLAGLVLALVHASPKLDSFREFPLWSGQQVAASIGSSLLFCAAFSLFLMRGSVRAAVVNGLLVMAGAACIIGILQFYGTDPLRPWDPRQPYNIYVREASAAVLNILQALTNGRMEISDGRLVLVLPRILGIYGNPDFFAPYLLQFIPITTALWILSPSRRWLTGGLTVLLVVTLVMTEVWGAFFSIVVIAPFFLSLVGHVRGRLSRAQAVRVAWSFLAAGIVLLLLLTWFLHASQRKSSAINERLLKLRMAGEMWRMAPVSGVGLNAYKSLYPVLQQKVRMQYELPFERLGSSFTQENRTHNDIAQMLAETGVIGTGLFLWLMAALLWAALLKVGEYRSLPAEDRALVVGLGGSVLVILVYALPNFPFHIVSSAGTFWVIAGLLASYRARPSGESRGGPASLLKWGAAATALIATLFGYRLFMGTLEYKRGDVEMKRRPPDFAAAEPHYARAIVLDPANAQYCYDFGAMCFNSMATNPGLASRAEELLRKSRLLGFMNEDLAYGLGMLAERRVDRKEALYWFGYATSLNERHEPSRQARLRILSSEVAEAERAWDHRRFSTALRLYRAGVDKNPGNFWALYRAGFLSATPFGDFASGTTWLDSAARMAVNEPSIWLALGRGLAQAGQLVDARRALVRAATLDPKNEEVTGALAQLEKVETLVARGVKQPPPGRK